MNRFIVVVATVTILVAMSVAARLRPGHLAELPMPWGPDGGPAWRLPTDAALASGPVFGAVVLFAVAFSARRPGPDRWPPPPSSSRCTRCTPR